MRDPVVRGGQGRSAASVRDAGLFAALMLLGASVFALGYLVLAGPGWFERLASVVCGWLLGLITVILARR